MNASVAMLLSLLVFMSCVRETRAQTDDAHFRSSLTTLPQDARSHLGSAFDGTIVRAIVMERAVIVLYQAKLPETAIRLSEFSLGSERNLWSYGDGDAVLSGTVPQPQLVAGALNSDSCDDLILVYSTNLAGSNENEMWHRQVLVFLNSPGQKTTTSNPLLLSAVDRHQGEDVHPSITAVSDPKQPARVCAGVAFITPYGKGSGSLTLVTYTSHYETETQQVGKVERRVQSLTFTDEGFEEQPVPDDPIAYLAKTGPAPGGLIIR